uniref:Si:ch73-233m11.2 n=1 Tax=Scleropages formosus TaxID=113540 RepID=A0A8C9V634_SCLFO
NTDSCDCLHELHKEAMKAYSFETRNTSLLGGQSPKEVVLTGQYVALNVENTDVKKDGETSSPILENTLTAVLSPSKDMTRLVMLFGPTGVGKTTAVQKMLLDWTGGKHLQQFGFVFPFAFRQLNVLKQEMTLEELLLNQHGHLAPESLGLILQTPQSLLFVFDGLEQYQHQLDVLSDSDICSQPNQAAPVPVLVSSLVHGALLQGASILVTARTRSELNSSSEVDCKHVEVSGFSVDQRKIYIDQFFKNPENAEKAFQHIEQKIGFQDICRLPVFCWITCTVLKAALEASQDLPETLTQVFVSAFVNLIHAHALGKTAARDLMLGLGRMAAHGLQNNAVVSSQKEMAAFGLQQFLTSPVLLGFLSFEGDPTSDNCMFSFRLPAVQDFLVAVSYYLDISEGKSLEEVLGRLEGRAALLKIFLSGLSSALQRKPLEGVVGEFSSDRHSEFTGWLRNSTEEAFQSWSKERRLCSIRLLHQCQNQPLVKEITAKLGCSLGASFEELTVWDAVALNYVVMCCGNLQDLNLYGNRSLTEDITQRLVPAFSYSHKLILPSCGLTAASCDDLASVLAQESSQLRLLDLRANKLEDEGLIQLCRGLSSPHCKLQQLGLDFCHLAGESMGALSQALCTGHSEIRSLNLNRNNLTDAGLESLTRVLRNSESKLQHLLSDCNLTKACCEGLAEALRSGCCSLMELDLSCSDLEDSGGLKLCEALKTHGCPLEVLRLVRCELGQATFQELGSILRSGSSKLKHLEVGLNNVGDEGAKYLWEALADSRCRLEILDMEMVTLTDNSLEDICSALRANHCLKELVLKNNGLTDTSVPSLHCIPQILESQVFKYTRSSTYDGFSLMTSSRVSNPLI